MLGLTNKEIIELRLKCLEPFVIIASKANIEQDVVIRKAELAWEYATKGLSVGMNETSEKSTSPLPQKSSMVFKK